MKVDYLSNFYGDFKDTEKKIDYFGKEVKISDIVVFIEPYYHNFTEGEIIKFTPKGVRVRYTNSQKYTTETVVYGSEFFLKEYCT